MSLTVRDHMTLRFEDQHWKYPGARETAIRDLFGETPTRYAQRLNALLDRPDALAAYPTTVRRLQRLRDARRTLRTARAS